MAIDWLGFTGVVGARLGKPYGFGCKWDPKDADPPGPIDCSGFVRWGLGRVGVSVPDGSSAQFDASFPVQRPQTGDVGFFRNAEGAIHHVGFWLDKDNVIEARGEPYDTVILRPVSKWEAWREFTGWRRFQAVADREAVSQG